MANVPKYLKIYKKDIGTKWENIDTSKLSERATRLLEKLNKYAPTEYITIDPKYDGYKEDNKYAIYELYRAGYVRREGTKLYYVYKDIHPIDGPEATRQSQWYIDAWAKLYADEEALAERIDSYYDYDPE